MASAQLFKNGNSQVVRLRGAQRRMSDVPGKLAKFSPDFMAQGRGESIEAEREA